MVVNKNQPRRANPTGRGNRRLHPGLLLCRIGPREDGVFACPVIRRVGQDIDVVNQFSGVFEHPLGPM